MKTLGQVAYEGYHHGTLKVGWENIAIREGWEAAAKAVRAAVLTEHGDYCGALMNAEAEILRLRADLEGALVAEKATAEKLAVAEEGHGATLAARWEAETQRDGLLAEIASLQGANAALRAATGASGDAGHYWTRQGDRLALMTLRPAEVAEILVYPESLHWATGGHTGRVNGTSSETLSLAQRLAEIAAGVQS